MSLSVGVFDLVLAALIVWLAWSTLAASSPFKAAVLFIVFSLLLALAWTRLDALDVALAEAAIGAGITGALVLDAMSRLYAGRVRKGGKGEDEDGGDG